MIDRYSARMTSADAAHSLYVFDDGLGAFGPLVDVRAAFSLRVGLGTMLERIEAKLKLLVAYQCLSWRFPDTFPERDQAAALREQLAGVLTDALSTLHSHDERVACAQCHRAMSFNSEFELCRECYRNQRQNNDPEEDPDYPDWS